MKQAALESRRLGPGGITVSALGLGCMGMSDAYGPADRAGSIATIRHALEVGVCLLDTADAYGRGHNEELVGAAIAGVRDRAVLATKFGIEVSGDGSRRINGRPEYVRACAEASLRRLGTDVIDVYYQHRVDKTVPIEETVGAMSELVAAGKVRYLGLSQASARSLERASAVHPIAALQTEWSIWTRELEGDVLTTARRLGIGIVAYCPLGRGFLAGAVTGRDALTEGDVRRTLPRFQDGNLPRNAATLAPDIVSASTWANGATECSTFIWAALATGGPIRPASPRPIPWGSSLSALRARWTHNPPALGELFPVWLYQRL